MNPLHEGENQCQKHKKKAHHLNKELEVWFPQKRNKTKVTIFWDKIAEMKKSMPSLFYILEQLPNIHQSFEADRYLKSYNVVFVADINNIV